MTFDNNHGSVSMKYLCIMAKVLGAVTLGTLYPLLMEITPDRERKIGSNHDFPIRKYVYSKTMSVLFNLNYGQI